MEEQVKINPKPGYGFGNVAKIGFGFGNIAEIGFRRETQNQNEAPNASSEEIPVSYN